MLRMLEECSRGSAVTGRLCFGGGDQIVGGMTQCQQAPHHIPPLGGRYDFCFHEDVIVSGGFIVSRSGQIAEYTGPEEPRHTGQ